jgi:PadR family transcriptional regulator, regulatory protein AphA
MLVISLTPTSYIVLGLLEQTGPATPYELKGLVGATIGDFWSVPHSQVYAEPDRLARGGYLSEIREQGGRRRRTYALTNTGRDALTNWREAATDELPELRDLALLKLFFGGPPATLAPTQLELHEHQLAAYQAAAAAVPEKLTGSGPARTLQAGIAHEQEWVRFWRSQLDG